MTSRLPALPSINDLLKIYNVKALKQLSQNFLLDKNLTNKFVRAAGNIENGEVCEIGPGPGSITRSILEKNPSKLFLIEKDERFKPMLESLTDFTDVPIYSAYADVRNFDLSKVFSDSLKKDWNENPPNIHLLGNLPFSVSTYLIIQWLKDISLKRNAWSFGRVKLTLTFQDEVAFRIIAPERSKMRSRLSIMCQNWCEPQYKFTIKGCGFLPKPEINVGVVHFEPLKEPRISKNFELLEKVLAVVFNTKKKYLRNAVVGLFPKELEPSLSEELLKNAGLNWKTRPINLSIEQWKGLITEYENICNRDPRLYYYDYRGSPKTREEEWKKEGENEDIKSRIINEQ